jgi:hypothetical protein
MIGWVWHEQIDLHPDHADFDFEFAKAHTYPRLDAAREAPLREAMQKWQRNLDDLVPVAFCFVLFCPVIIVLAYRKLGIALIGLLFMSGIGFGLLLSFPGTILRFAFPPTYFFYDDFAYVKGLDWNTEKEQAENIIIAYEAVPSRPDDYRGALLMNGFPTYLHMDCIAMLLTAQKQGTPKRIQEFLYRGPGCEEIKNQPSITPQPSPARPILAPDN